MRTARNRKATPDYVRGSHSNQNLRLSVDCPNPCFALLGLRYPQNEQTIHGLFQSMLWAQHIYNAGSAVALQQSNLELVYAQCACIFLAGKWPTIHMAPQGRERLISKMHAFHKKRYKFFELYYLLTTWQRFQDKQKLPN